jgi:uncharacterized membrane protein YecN with MAPEG domain
METLPITSALAGAAAIFLVLLSFPVANHRRANKLSAGDGGDEAFNRKVRAQANFIEYTPLAIIAIGLLEMNGMDQLWVCGLAAALAAARVLHAIGLIWNVLIGRMLGAILTFATLLFAGGVLVWHSFF